MFKTILIIEDDKSLQDFLVNLLNDNSYSVKALKDGIAALETVEKINPDLVLLDLGLPTLNGESVCKQIKKSYPSIPVIVVTAKTAMNDKLNAFELGADDYITKPFSSEEL